LQTSKLILDFEFDQHLESHKHVISLIMGFRDTGCYRPRCTFTPLPHRQPPPPRHLRALVSAAPLRRHLHPTGVGAPKLARRVCLESVALTTKTLSTVDCRPLAGGLATPAAESMPVRQSRTLVRALGSAVDAPVGRPSRSRATLQSVADHC
jgi:hypothetical protein